MAKTTMDGVWYTLACEAEAKRLRAYCEARFPVGAMTPSSLLETSTRHTTKPWLSPTGEEFTELCQHWREGHPSAQAACEAAQHHFDQYAEGRTGTLYWRTVPEIAYSASHRKYGYYLRLLISNKQAD